MKIFHLRILLDDSEDVFRDIEIEKNASFLDLHEIILKAFNFSGLEMASFYQSNEYWDRGEEIVQMDTMKDPEQNTIRAMADTPLHEMMRQKGDKMLYLYDFMRMWIFYIELMDETEGQKDITYPQVVLWVGNAPAEDSKSAESISFTIEDEDDFYEDDIDFDDDFDAYDDSYDY